MKNLASTALISPKKAPQSAHINHSLAHASLSHRPLPAVPGVIAGSSEAAPSAGEMTTNLTHPGFKPVRLHCKEAEGGKHESI